MGIRRSPDHCAQHKKCRSSMHTHTYVSAHTMPTRWYFRGFFDHRRMRFSTKHITLMTKISFGTDAEFRECVYACECMCRADELAYVCVRCLLQITPINMRFGRTRTMKSRAHLAVVCESIGQHRRRHHCCLSAAVSARQIGQHYSNV